VHECDMDRGARPTQPSIPGDYDVADVTIPADPRNYYLFGWIGRATQPCPGGAEYRSNWPWDVADGILRDSPG
jgi:hypothetical protein